MSIRQDRDQILSPHLQHRVEILQSNIERVYHQHQTLKPILQHSHFFLQIQKLVNFIESLKTKASKVKEISNKLYIQSKSRKYQTFGASQSIETKFKNANDSIYLLKEKLKTIEKYIENPHKQFIGTVKTHIGSLNNKVNAKIQNSKNDIQQLLQHIKLKENKQVNQNLETQSSKFCKKYEGLIENIMREIGLVHCQIMYLIDSSRRQEITKQLNSIKIQKDQVIKNIQLGRLQRKILEIELDEFIYENSRRLNYQSNILKCKIQELSQCLKNKKNNKNVSNEVIHIEYRVQDIKFQQRGISKYLEVQNSKIRHNIGKINSLSNSYEQFQNYTINNSRFQIFRKVKSKIKSVEETLQTIKKNKIIQ